MKRLNKIILVTFALLLSACGPTPPSEADGWEQVEEIDLYVKREVYSKSDPIVTEILSLYEGTWTSTEHSDIGVVIKDEKVYIGLANNYNTFEVSDYELMSTKYTSKDQKYEDGEPVFNLVVDASNIYGAELLEVSIDGITLDEDIRSKSGYGLRLFVYLLNSKPSLQILERSNINYTLIGSSTEKNQKKDLKEEVVTNEKKVSRPKKETLGSKAKKDAEARRRKEANRVKKIRREEERREEEKRIRQKDDEKAIEEQRVKLISEIVNKHLGEFLQGEYKLNFIYEEKETIQIEPNANAYNGKVHEIFTYESYEVGATTEEWAKLTNRMIDLSIELEEVFPGEGIRTELTAPNGITGYLTLVKGEVIYFAYDE